MPQPHLYVIAGPNGAGKTTFAREFLPGFADCPLFVNVDDLARNISPRQPRTVALEAGKRNRGRVCLPRREHTQNIGTFVGRIMKKDKMLSKPALVKKVEKALKAAADRAAAEHRRSGNPLVIWRDGKIVKIPANKI
jgi:predicted ABC-type ATPase